jgi:hypothetical protein
VTQEALGRRGPAQALGENLSQGTLFQGWIWTPGLECRQMSVSPDIPSHQQDMKLPLGSGDGK